MFQSIVISIALFVALLAGQEVGRWLGRRHLESKDDEAKVSGPADTIVYAVLGLLIAFTFTSSASRFDERRRLNVEQANALGTAWLRIDTLLEPDRPAIRQNMRKWVDLELETVQNAGNLSPAELRAHFDEAQTIQNEVWQLAVAAAQRQPKATIGPFVLSPINDWIDLSTTRAQMNNMGTPTLIVMTLVVLAMIASVLAGFSSSKSSARSALHMLAFAAVIPFSIYIILDLNHPRSGLIRVDDSDTAMIQLRDSFRSVAPISTGDTHAASGSTQGVPSQGGE